MKEMIGARSETTSTTEDNRGAQGRRAHSNNTGEGTTNVHIQSEIQFGMAFCAFALHAVPVTNSSGRALSTNTSCSLSFCCCFYMRCCGRALSAVILTNTSREMRPRVCIGNCLFCVAILFVERACASAYSNYLDGSSVYWLRQRHPDTARWPPLHLFGLKVQRDCCSGLSSSLFLFSSLIMLRSLILNSLFLFSRA